MTDTTVDAQQQVRAAIQALVDDLREERFEFNFKRPAAEMYAKGIASPEFDKGYAKAINGAVQVAERHLHALLKPTFEIQSPAASPEEDA